MPRHDHDTVALLWEGAADPTSLMFVPVELRDVVAGIPEETEEKLRRELYAVRGEMIVTNGLKVARTLTPSTNEADFEIALVVSKNSWARRQLDNERDAAKRDEHDRRTYTCQCCGQVTYDSKHRTFADGSSAKVCGKCSLVVEALVVDKLGSDKVVAGTGAGKTRADRARAILNGTTPGTYSK